MSDPFDQLLDTLQTTPPPRKGEDDNRTKNQAISKAVAAFDKKNAPKRQVLAHLLRPIDTALAAINHWIRSLTMKRIYITAGAACLGVLALGIVQLQPNFFMPPKTLELRGEIEKRTNHQEAEETKTAKHGMLSADVSAPLSERVVESDAAKETLTAGAEPREMIVASKPAITMPSAPPMGATDMGQMAGAEMAAQVAPTPMPSTRGLTKSKMMVNGGHIAPSIGIMPEYQPQGGDQFEGKAANPVKLVTEAPVSTFSIDVDTASYSFMRSSLNSGITPKKEQIRTEELINYFPYDYQAPISKDKPFKANVSVYPTPWNPDTQLMHIGIKGYELKQNEKPRSNLVFLIDTSGSMNQQNKLPLLINSFKLMLDGLKPNDRVGIVTYAGNAGVVLAPTLVEDKATIIAALENLRAGGSTAGAAGIRQAYLMAESYQVEGGINRVILATDGDFNVGITDPDELKSYIEEKRDSGVFLSILGFGRGNYNDALMQTLAQHGNGNASYIDTLSEAQKVLVEEAGSTIFPIAKDVKIQVEFNPNTVEEYRLIGYETRMLNREDFNNDKVDAGDIGAGHSVTAIYELTPVGSKGKMIDDLRYGKPVAVQATPEMEGNQDELAFVKMRYKLPDSSTSKLITTPVGKSATYDSFEAAPTDTRFATTVAAFGQKLQGGEYLKDYSVDDMVAAATAAKGDDPFGYRAEFIRLMKLAK